MNLDVFLFHALNNFVGTIPWLDALTRAIVNDYLVPTVAALTLVAFWVSGSDEQEQRRNRRAVIITLIAFGLTLAIVKDIWNIYYRARPFTDEPVQLLFYRPSVSSFPSLPVAIVFCFAAGARLANAPAGVFLYTLGMLFAIARVYAGVHYPVDVIAGAALGESMTRVVERLSFAVNPLADRVIELAQRFYFV